MAKQSEDEAMSMEVAKIAIPSAIGLLGMVWGMIKWLLHRESKTHEKRADSLQASIDSLASRFDHGIDAVRSMWRETDRRLDDVRQDLGKNYSTRAEVREEMKHTVDGAIRPIDQKLDMVIEMVKEMAKKDIV